jgi:hypothetical protein
MQYILGIGIASAGKALIDERLEVGRDVQLDGSFSTSILSWPSREF